MMRATSVTWTTTSNGSEMCVEHDEGDIDSANPVPELRQGLCYPGLVFSATGPDVASEWNSTAQSDQFRHPPPPSVSIAPLHR
jgi:hypothetical protein